MMEQPAGSVPNGMLCSIRVVVGKLTLSYGPWWESGVATGHLLAELLLVFAPQL
jgi:hypothetical protein